MGIATLTKSAEVFSPEIHGLTKEELRSLQLLLLDMVKDIAQVCREHTISWSLAGGSALGAVRHKGFIPWDDDVDLAMLREDFSRFREVFPGRFSDKYELRQPGDSGYLYPFPKVYRKGTVAQNIQSDPNVAEAVSLDIFIMENASDSKLLRTLHGLVCTGLLAIGSAVRMGRCRENLLKYGAGSKKLCAAVKIRCLFGGCFRFLSLEQWLRLSDRIFSLCKNTNSEYIVIPSGNGHYFGELYLRDKMRPGAIIDFEGERFFTFQTPEYFLSLHYGEDYMMLPPESSREQHRFIRFGLNHI